MAYREKSRPSDAVTTPCPKCQQSAAIIWPSCWKCSRPLGCYLCNSGIETEVMCQLCVTWGTMDALAEHGPISNHPRHVRLREGRYAPAIEEYPLAWRSHYQRTESRFQHSLQQPRTDRGKQVMVAMMDALKKGETLKYEELIIQAWERAA